MKRFRLACLCVSAAVLAVLLAGCGVAPYTSGTTPDIPAAIEKAGAVVLDSGTTKNEHPGGTTATWYEVGRPGSDEVRAVVNVLTFESARDRNAAYRVITNRTRNGSSPALAYTAGDSVVMISRLKDWGTVKDLNNAFKDAGLK